MGTLHITLFTYRTLVYLTVIDIKNTKTQTKIHFQLVLTNNSIKNYFFLKKSVIFDCTEISVNITNTFIQFVNHFQCTIRITAFCFKVDCLSFKRIQCSQRIWHWFVTFRNFRTYAFSIIIFVKIELSYIGDDGTR